MGARDMAVVYWVSFHSLKLEQEPLFSKNYFICLIKVGGIFEIEVSQGEMLFFGVLKGRDYATLREY